MIDFHSHFLPNIDDGSRSVEESIKILDLMAANGIDTIVATPHFYCSEKSSDKFIEDRTAAYERIKPFLKPEHPKIYFGGEVLYDRALVNYEKLHDLCINGTDWLLLEMPYTDLTDKMIDGVAEIVDRGDVKVYVAHIERYLNFTPMKRLEELMSLDLIGQINAVDMLSFKTRLQCNKLIKNGYVQLLGSDLHRITRNHVPVNKGFEVIEKKFKGFTEEAERNGRLVLDNAPLEALLD